MTRVLATAVMAVLGVQAAQAEAVFWTDWISGTAGPGGSATGALNVDGTDVTVSYAGEIYFIQTDGGTNYWEPSAPYISPTVPNAPPTSDIIALSTATPKVITFSQAIVNPLFSVVSLNGNGYEFDRDFEILSMGTGYWGAGTLSKEVLPGGIFRLIGTGEPHGVIQFQGATTSISWTSLTAEQWNGFTIGVTGLAPSVIPEPSTLALCSPVAMVGGLAGWRWQRRRKAA